MSEIQIVDFVIQKQLKSNWCWAAVTASLSAYYGKQNDADQTRLVTKIMHPKNSCEGEECKTCNRPWYVGEALEMAGILREAIPNTISEKRLINELNHHHPVVIAVKCRGIVSGHTFVISSMMNDGTFATWDSKTLDVEYLSYHQLTTSSSQKGKWVNTFLTGLRETYL